MPEREVAVCRELTKRFEEVVRGTAAEVAERFDGAAEGRDHARRSGRPRRRAPTTARSARSPRSPSSSPPACRGGGRRRSSRASTGVAAEPALQRVAVSRFDNAARPRYPARPVAHLDNKAVLHAVTRRARCSCCSSGRRAAQAWSWPVHGPVLQPFAYDEAHPYAAGQHRGIDIGADAAGEQVVAPAAGDGELRRHGADEREVASRSRPPTATRSR